MEQAWEKPRKLFVSETDRTLFSLASQSSVLFWLSYRSVINLIFGDDISIEYLDKIAELCRSSRFYQISNTSALERCPSIRLTKPFWIKKPPKRETRQKIDTFWFRTFLNTLKRRKNEKKEIEWISRAKQQQWYFFQLVKKSKKFKIKNVFDYCWLFDIFWVFNRFNAVPIMGQFNEKETK